MIDPDLVSSVGLKRKTGVLKAVYVLKDEGNFLTSLSPLLNL